MDSFLLDYLKSGKAWVLIGSGPSIQMGYPSWEKLAASAVEVAKVERLGGGLDKLDAALRCRDFPMVFDEVKAILGGPRLLQCLQDKLKPGRPGRIYELIARWPVPVYLTTNYDDEIQNHLAKSEEAYVTYSNSEDHFGYLLPELQGAIIKLHGDLRSENGLILTSSQYKEIEQGEAWRYWRTKMTSVFQMNRVIVIGHSLTDKNIKHILEAAKKGAGVLQPICWIAPNVTPHLVREYLEKYRIRVIPYDDQGGEHGNLVRLIENITDFVPPRTAIHIQQQIAKVSQSVLETNAAAPGFFVFNKLSIKADFEEKRIAAIIAAIQSTLPKLKFMKDFTLEAALEIAGWPKDSPLPPDLVQKLRAKAGEQQIFVPTGDKFNVHDKAEVLASESKRLFDHMRNRFKNSLVLRIKRNFPAMKDGDADLISSDIEASLTGYFRECGLSLATTLFATGHPSTQVTVPSSIIKFINEASARYDDFLMRQAFFSASIESFAHGESAEREYLGRISQGFFAFHLLGVFGDAANERVRHAKETIWLVDSDTQIPALALAAPSNSVIRDTFQRLHSVGLRLLATEKLFDETREHLWFAANVIKDNGPMSHLVMAAAMGQSPYRKSNAFLAGFIRWQAAGNPCDWESYMTQIFERPTPDVEDIGTALEKIGIEVIDFKDWPGFLETDYAERVEYTGKIKKIMDDRLQKIPADEIDQLTDSYKKAEPEAEALIIVKKERNGNYHLISGCGEKSPAWFISHTSILNIVEPGTRITWQPESFLSFASTLAPPPDSKSSDQAFEIILWGLAQSGLNVLDEKTVTGVFGGAIDQATLNIQELRKAYEDTLSQKYCEPPESVLERVRPIDRPLVAIQLANEIAQVAVERSLHAEKAQAEADGRAKSAEKKLKGLERFKWKMEDRKKRAQRKARKRQSSSKKKK